MGIAHKGRPRIRPGKLNSLGHWLFFAARLVSTLLSCVELLAPGKASPPLFRATNEIRLMQDYLPPGSLMSL